MNWKTWKVYGLEVSIPIMLDMQMISKEISKEMRKRFETVEMYFYRQEDDEDSVDSKDDEPGSVTKNGCYQGADDHHKEETARFPGTYV